MRQLIWGTLEQGRTWATGVSGAQHGACTDSHIPSGPTRQPRHTCQLWPQMQTGSLTQHLSVYLCYSPSHWNSHSLRRPPGDDATCVSLWTATILKWRRPQGYARPGLFAEQGFPPMENLDPSPLLVGSSPTQGACSPPPALSSEMSEAYSRAALLSEGVSSQVGTFLPFYNPICDSEIQKQLKVNSFFSQDSLGGKPNLH